MHHLLNGSVVVSPCGPLRIKPGDCGLHLRGRLVICGRPILSVGGRRAVHSVVVPPRKFILRPKILCLNEAIRFATARQRMPVLRNHSSVNELNVFVRIATNFNSINFHNF